MSSSFEIRREGEVDYSKPLARALLRDSRLSFGARGLFAFLWDLPGGWRTNTEHLATMSPLKRDGIRTLLKELEAVGAMRDEAIRGEGGRLAGRRWVLIAPERWAIESPLSTHKSLKAAPEASSTERRVSRFSVKPTVGKTNTKVHQGEGSSIKTTTKVSQALVAEEIDDLVEAAVWATRRGGKKINNDTGFRHKVRVRILAGGPSAEDVQSVNEWRTANAPSAPSGRQARPEMQVDEDFCAKGFGMLPPSLRERAQPKS